MSRYDNLNNIHTLVYQLEDFKQSQILRAFLGTESLDVLSKEFDEILVKSRLLVENKQKISVLTLQDVESVLREIAKIFDGIKAISNLQFVEKKEDNLNNLQFQFDTFRSVWQPIGWMFEKKTNNSTDEEFHKAQHVNAKLQEELANVRTLASSLEQQAEEYKTRYSDINVNVELETQVNVFKTQAEQNRKESIKWLVGAVLFGGVLFVSLLIIYCNFELPAKGFTKYKNYNEICETCGEHVLWVDMLRYIFFKFLILSVEIYMLTFCVKNYNACMHNKTNNEHRHNSFAAALHFYNTTTGDKRDEILIKVADAIFTYQKSGYYGKDSEPANPSLIQSVVDKVAGKS